MRHLGSSIHDISERLRVPKSTVSLWCRDILLSSTQQRALINIQRRRGVDGAIKAAERKRADRLERTRLSAQLGVQDVGTVSRRDLLLLGLGLYWGEGNKRGNDELGLTNSDPAIVRTFMYWMRSIYGARDTDFVLRLSVNIRFRARLRDIQAEWARITGIPLAQFTRPSLVNSSLKRLYDDGRAYRGTLRVKVRRGTDLRRRILGSIEHLQLTSKTNR
jgi:hypothetical protein